jgi:hypothetical protein
MAYLGMCFFGVIRWIASAIYLISVNEYGEQSLQTSGVLASDMKQRITRQRRVSS